MKGMKGMKVKGFWRTAPADKVAEALNVKAFHLTTIPLNRVTDGVVPDVLPETRDGALLDGVLASTILTLWHFFLRKNIGLRFFVVFPTATGSEVGMATVVHSDVGPIVDFVHPVTAHDVECARHNFEEGVKAWFRTHVPV